MAAPREQATVIGLREKFDLKAVKCHIKPFAVFHRDIDVERREYTISSGLSVLRSPIAQNKWMAWSAPGLYAFQSTYPIHCNDQ